MQNPPPIHIPINENPELKSFQQALQDRDFKKIQALLLQDKKLFYIKDQDGAFPIIKAIDDDDQELATCLLSVGNYKYLRDPNYNSFAHLALSKNKKKVFKAIININPSLLIEKNNDDMIPILEILKKDDEELFDFIAENHTGFLFVKDRQNLPLSEYARIFNKPKFFAKILKKYHLVAQLVAQQQSNFEIPFNDSFVAEVKADFFKNVIDLIDSHELKQILTSQINSRDSILDLIIFHNRRDLLDEVLKKCPDIIAYCENISLMGLSHDNKIRKQNSLTNSAIDMVFKNKFGDDYITATNQKLLTNFFDAASILLLTNNVDDFSSFYLNVLSRYSRFNESSKFKSLETNEYPHIFDDINEFFKKPDGHHIKLPNENKLIISPSNIEDHDSFFLFNLDKNDHLTSVTYCDGHIVDRCQKIDKELNQIYGATTYSFKTAIKDYKPFIQNFLDLNKSTNNFDEFYKRGVLFPSNAEVAEKKLSVPIKSQIRGNCSIKSTNILAQFIAEQLSLQPVVYEEDDDGKLTCNSKRKFKEYKELIMYHSLDSLSLMVEDLKKKENRSELEKFILKHSNEVLKISHLYQIQKIQRIRDNDALLESRRRAMDIEDDDLSGRSSPFSDGGGFCDYWGASPAPNPTTTSASPAPNPTTTSASPAPNPTTTSASPPPNPNNNRVAFEKQKVASPPL